ncbi:hypothetical protein BHE74_00013772 [Ensete ventricosum]|nr:hypothetical protein GW17_00007455 [Ensete ventricosum]RWW78033.1 hypothetical protein BHE74_00013772 [Ensete ventricosum]
MGTEMKGPKDRERIESVLKILKKQAPVTVKQIEFCTGFFKSASAFLNLFVSTLKIISEYYPGRLHKAFVIDPPSLFSYLWKVCDRYACCLMKP